MSLEQYAFETEQLLYVCPVIMENCGNLRIKITSENNGGRKTKWMNITPRQFRLIEEVLMGDRK